MISYTCIVVVEILELDKEGTLEEDLMEGGSSGESGDGDHGYGGGLGGRFGGLVLVMEEDLDMATRIGLQSERKEMMEVRIAIIWEIISRNLQSTSY